MDVGHHLLVVGECAAGDTGGRLGVVGNAGCAGLQCVARVWDLFGHERDDGRRRTAAGGSRRRGRAEQATGEDGEARRTENAVPCIG